MEDGTKVEDYSITFHDLHPIPQKIKMIFENLRVIPTGDPGIFELKMVGEFESKYKVSINIKKKSEERLKEERVKKQEEARQEAEEKLKAEEAIKAEEERKAKEAKDKLMAEQEAEYWAKIKEAKERFEAEEAMKAKKEQEDKEAEGKEVEPVVDNNEPIENIEGERNEE